MVLKLREYRIQRRDFAAGPVGAKLKKWLDAIHRHCKSVVPVNSITVANDVCYASGSVTTVNQRNATMLYKKYAPLPQ